MGLLVTTLAAAAVSAPSLSAQLNFRTLVSFGGSNGVSPPAPLVQGLDGNLYGTTYAGGANGGGTVFKVTTTGTVTTLYSFCAQAGCPDGKGPNGGVVLATDGNFYGTTLVGGNAGNGTVFQITASGTLTSLYSFCSQPGCSDGKHPFAGLTQGSDGNLYGTTVLGGTYGQGTVFQITPQGVITVLHSFQGSDGTEPYGGVIQATDGNFYGTTYYGGANLAGTVFQITTAGALTTLYSFCAEPSCADGAEPYSALVEGSDGLLYGTTELQGPNWNGTLFNITTAGSLTILYNFCGQTGCPDGGYPHAALIQGTDGNFYGTTDRGGTSGCGTIFKLSGTTLRTLYNFRLRNGTEPDGMTEATNGVLYGTTLEGGINILCPYNYGCGTIYTLNESLGSFVETLPTSGPVGVTVEILGTNLTGATAVTFNGVAAAFTVDSATEITTTVPANATTGTVQVTLPAGVLSSNVPFYVLQ